MLGLGQGDSKTPPAPPRDAATVILVRPAEAAPFEVLLLRRTGRAGFLANALVFPGGRVDAADAAHAEHLLEPIDGPEQAAHRLGEPLERLDVARALWVAAIRETFEEAGVLLGASPPPDTTALETVRTELNDGRLDFGAALTQLAVRLDPAGLHYVARWITPEIEPKRFDTRFFLARVPSDQAASHDDRETTHSAWVSPADIVAECDAGRAALAPPTYRILETLARLTSIDAVFESRSGLPPVIRPRFTLDGEALVLLLPGDAEYEPDTVPASARNRITLRGERWVSEGEGY
jgi:8-oxo-dGTP pyrophosphatase MutT (NUDIX family)